jgi:endoglucanase
MGTRFASRTGWLAGLATVGLCVTSLAVGVSSATASSGTGRSLSPTTRFFVPAPSAGAITQIKQLLQSGDFKDAALIAKMVTTPQAVWFNGGTPQQATQQARQTMFLAGIQHAVPVISVYDIPGRDCAQYSAGGALDLPSYEAWINGLVTGLGQHKVVVILETDALGNLPSNCGGPKPGYPFTDTDRYAELNYAVNALETDSGASVYLDATHSSWLGVGDITNRLLQAGVQNAQGFFVNVSNYQPTPELVDYGTWISDCLAIVTDPANPLYNNPSACASQYYPATQSDFSTWGLTTAWYAQNMGTSVATKHFVIDTSRNGNGPNLMQAYGAAPYNQSAATVATLKNGNWCNPPGSGLGLKPTADTGVPLLDAYLWVKTPGQSDGQCDAAGGVRAWDYSLYTQPGWPTAAADQALFDPLWGLNDPAAGAWFPQQALQLAQLASQ